MAERFCSVASYTQQVWQVEYPFKLTKWELTVFLVRRPLIPWELFGVALLVASSTRSGIGMSFQVVRRTKKSSTTRSERWLETKTSITLACLPMQGLDRLHAGVDLCDSSMSYRVLLDISTCIKRLVCWFVVFFLRRIPEQAIMWFGSSLKSL